MSFIVIIPARYASTRLPAKPLRDIAGLSMIQRVWQQALKSNAAQVVIATDDSRIELAAQASLQPFLLNPQTVLCGPRNYTRGPLLSVYFAHSGSV